MEIRDDGAGLRRQNRRSREWRTFWPVQHAGRAEKIGAHFSLITKPGHGTEIRVAVTVMTPSTPAAYSSITGLKQNIPMGNQLNRDQPSVPMTKKIRIMVVDDHFVVRMGLVGSINIEADMVVEMRLPTDSRRSPISAGTAQMPCSWIWRLPDISGLQPPASFARNFPHFNHYAFYPRCRGGHLSITQAGARTYLLKTAARES